MASGSNAELLKAKNFRLCQIVKWKEAKEVGFNIESTGGPPFSIINIESNSPAAASGLRLNDVILAVNKTDVSKMEYRKLGQTIKEAVEKNKLELLVIEKKNYDDLKTRNVKFNRELAKVVTAPSTIPAEYLNFPADTPRVCEIRLNAGEQSFGFDLTGSPTQTGAIIQEIVPNSAAARTPLRRFDRIIELNDEYIDETPHQRIRDKIGQAKTNGSVKFFVVDTKTYKYRKSNNIPWRTPTSSSTTVREPSARVNDSDSDEDEPEPPVTPDIRLCSITKKTASDSYGITLKYHKNDKYHTLTIAPAPGSTQSYASLAGVKDGDYLIEVNGENVQQMDDPTVKNKIKSIQHPNPLILLVVDANTFNYYKRIGQTINSRLPNVKKLPISGPSRKSSSSSDSSAEGPRRGIASLVPTFPGRTQEEPQFQSPSQVGSTIGRLVSPNERSVRLQLTNNRNQLGFNIDTTDNNQKPHRMANIIEGSLADEAGLREGNIIVSINNKLVENLSRNEVITLLREAIADAKAKGNPIMLTVRDDASPADLSISQISDDEKETPAQTVRNPSIHSIRPLGVNVELRSLIVPKSKFILNQDFQIDEPQFGLEVVNIKPASFAYRAGLRKGDRVIEINDRDVQNFDVDEVLTLIQQIQDRNQDLKLLVIDENGYKLFKNKMGRVDKSVKEASIRRISIPRLDDSSDSDGEYLVTQPKPSIEAVVTVTRPTPSIEPSRPSIKPILQNIYDKPSGSIIEEGTYSGSTGFYRNSGIRASGHPDKNTLMNRQPAKCSRTMTHITSGKSSAYVCHLKNRSDEKLGFSISEKSGEYTINNITEEIAHKTGLKSGDVVISIDNQYLSQRTMDEVQKILRQSESSGNTVLFIEPSTTRNVDKPENGSGSLANSSIPSSSGSHHIPAAHRLLKFHEANSASPLLDYSDPKSDPSDPWPRECVLEYDPNFKGWGFQLLQKDGTDAAIIVHVVPNSPAKRSGLVEGDHIIYINKDNVQGLLDFKDKITTIQNQYQNKRDISLTVLTSHAYRLLRRRGGKLTRNRFFYNNKTSQVNPRFYKLRLDTYDYDFGFSYYRDQPTVIKRVKPFSIADSYKIQSGDKILEINGQDTSKLFAQEISDLFNESKQKRSLSLLLIDRDGYEYCHKHAIPINSQMAIVRSIDEKFSTETKDYTEAISL